MLTLSAFARGRDVEPKTVSIYMKRHNMTYNKDKGLTDEQIAILDEVYPIPKPVIVVNGLSAEEERQLREELDEVRKKLDVAKDKIIELTERNATLQLLEDKASLQEQELQRLKSRNLWERLINKGV